MSGLPFAEAAQLVMQLRNASSSLVLAESCTCGMAAALIGGVPGASAVLCGSAVTYQESVKMEWLGVEAATLRQYTAESPQVTQAMALGVLRRTPAADWGAAITGHLGPQAPATRDGRVFLSLARRGVDGEDAKIVAGQELMLESTPRSLRQIEAAQALLRWLLAEVR